jgi:peptide deformylase
MANLIIARLGNPVIRQKAKPLSPLEIQSENMRQLIRDMSETMNKNSGVGIAAPQVNVSKRLLIIDVPEHAKFPGHEVVPLTVMINPEIEFISDKKFELWEGCLSVPGLTGKVKRFENIRVTFIDVQGKRVIREFKGFPSAVVQHEYDHLDGIVYLDRMEDLSTLAFNEEFEKFVEKESSE